MYQIGLTLYNISQIDYMVYEEVPQILPHNYSKCTFTNVCCNYDMLFVRCIVFRICMGKTYMSINMPSTIGPYIYVTTVTMHTL